MDLLKREPIYAWSGHVRCLNCKLNIPVENGEYLTASKRHVNKTRHTVEFYFTMSPRMA